MAARNVPLRSASISATYDDETQKLDITFIASGRTYTHPDVPQTVVDGLVRAPSPGAFYNSEIKGSYG